MTLPRISVVTITYGHERYILDCIKGVLSQQYDGEIEFIIANDKSPDNTDQIVNDYLKVITIPSNIKINYVKHDVNIGMIENFFWALNQCSGDFIAICEGDDYWVDRKKLEKQESILSKNLNVKICCTNFYKTTNTNKYEKVKYSQLNKFFFNYEDLIRDNIVGTLTSLFRNPGKLFFTELKNVLKSNNFLMGDYVLWLLLIHDGGEVFVLKDYTSVYRVNVESASQSRDKNKLVNFINSILNIKKYFLFKNLNSSNFRILYSQLLNTAYYFLLSYDNQLSKNYQKDILLELKKNSLRLNFRNKLKRMYRKII